MADAATVREIFGNLALAEAPLGPLRTRLEGATSRFDLGDAGSFHVRFAGGRATVRESSDAADCELQMTADDFVDAVRGRRNLVTAFLQGRVQVRGSLLLAESIHAYLRYLEYQRHQAAAQETRP